MQRKNIFNPPFRELLPPDCFTKRIRALTFTPGFMAASPLLSLVRKDILMEWRQKHTLFGVLLYVGSTVFVIYMMNGQPVDKVWNALFWLTQLFVAVNAVAKSFLQESVSRFRYYYSIVRPQTFMLAKMIYSLVLQTFMTLVSLVLFWIMLGDPITQNGLFACVALLGGISLALVFTFISAIAARANQNTGMMAIIGFPLVTPVLMILGNLALKAIAPVYQPGWWSLAGVLALFDVLVVVLSVILFPFLWKE